MWKLGNTYPQASRGPPSPVRPAPRSTGSGTPPTSQHHPQTRTVSSSSLGVSQQAFPGSASPPRGHRPKRAPAPTDLPTASQSPRCARGPRPAFRWRTQRETRGEARRVPISHRAPPHAGTNACRPPRDCGEVRFELWSRCPLDVFVNTRRVSGRVAKSTKFLADATEISSRAVDERALCSGRACLRPRCRRPVRRRGNLQTSRWW